MHDGARHLHPEGCYNCHSQMIRPFRCRDAARYGLITVGGRVCVRPPVPVGQQAHRSRPAPRGRQITTTNGIASISTTRAMWCLGSNMPAYPGLEKNQIDPADVAPRMRRCAPWACPTPTRRFRCCRWSRGKTERGADRLPAGVGTPSSKLRKDIMDITTMRHLHAAVVRLFHRHCSVGVFARQPRAVRGGSPAALPTRLKPQNENNP